jgi:acyl carrier protein
MIWPTGQTAAGFGNRASAQVRVLVACTTAPVPVATLTPAEGARFGPMRGTPRERQWLTSRAALRLLLGLLGLERNTAAYRFPHRRLSMSHTETVGVAAGVVDPVPASLVGFGVDAEPERRVDPRTGRFFLNPREQAWISGLPPARRSTEQLRLWTVKEALFKADPDNRLAVLTHFVTRNPMARGGAAHNVHRTGLSFGYASRCTPDAIHLTVAASFRDAPAMPTGTPATTAGPSSTKTRSGDQMPTTITFDQVAERVSATLSVPVDKLTPETSLHDLAVDSFRLVEMVVDLQEEFDSMFTQAELKQLVTLGELFELLRSH